MIRSARFVEPAVDGRAGAGALLVVAVVVAAVVVASVAVLNAPVSVDAVSGAAIGCVVVVG